MDQHIIGKAKTILERKFDDTDIFGFKDPRTAKLIDFWKIVFADIGCVVRYILVVRNPVSVARSLSKRDGFLQVHSYALWLDYLLCSIRGSENERRIFIDYDYLMEAPETQIKIISKAFELQINEEELDIYCSEFLNKKLRHAEYKLDDISFDNNCPVLLAEIYQSCRNAAKHERHPSRDLFFESSWSVRFTDIIPIASQVIAIASDLNKKNEELAYQKKLLMERSEECRLQIMALEKMEADIDVMTEDYKQRVKQVENLYLGAMKDLEKIKMELDSVYSSFSWRLLRPLRFVALWLSRLCDTFGFK